MPQHATVNAYGYLNYLCFASTVAELTKVQKLVMHEHCILFEYTQFYSCVV
jgi:hypothetical protein